MTRLVGLFAATLGSVLLGKGTWIYLKAKLAQVLLGLAWTASLASGEDVRPWPWADTHPVARLAVPELGVEQIVLAGASGRTLAFAPGWLDGSAVPGEEGNVVIAGHRDTHFAFLEQLREGDEIELAGRDGMRRTYRVESATVVDQRDTRSLEQAQGDTLTLITCYPFDAVAPGGPLRFVVRARRPAPEHLALAGGRAPAGSRR